MPSPRASKPSRIPTHDARVRALLWLRANSSPRLLMSLMLASTIGSGFLASVVLLHIGVRSPLARYPLAVLVAWVTFLSLVSIWVWWHRRVYSQRQEMSNARSARDSGNTQFDISGGHSGHSGSASGGNWSGGGGRFGGGGASDSYAEPTVLGFSGDASAGSSGSSGSSGFDLDFGGDDVGAIVLLIVVAIVAAAVLGMAFYVIYSAPTFFAELLVDGGVGTWLYKRANIRERPDWLATAMRRSVLPMIVALVLFAGLAWTMQLVAPGSATLVQAWGAVTALKPAEP